MAGGILGVSACDDIGVGPRIARADSPAGVFGPVGLRCSQARILAVPIGIIA